MAASERSSGKAPPTAASSGGEELVMTRTFDAPRELVFDAFTKREHLERWQAHRWG